MSIAIVINTCSKYYKTTIPPLLKSIGNQCQDIFVVVGESENECVEGIYNFVTYGNIDNTALIWAKETNALLSFEYIFYLHDTCKVTPTFFENVKLCIQKNPNCDAISIHSPYSMCIGTYKLDSLRKLSLSKNKDFSKKTMLRIKNDVEDQIFRMMNTFCLNSSRVVLNDRVYVYETNVHRIIEFYEMPGVYKFKGSYGVYPSHLDL